MGAWKKVDMEDKARQALDLSTMSDEEITAKHTVDVLNKVEESIEQSKEYATRCAVAHLAQGLEHDLDEILKTADHHDVVWLEEFFRHHAAICHAKAENMVDEARDANIDPLPGMEEEGEDLLSITDDDQTLIIHGEDDNGPF